MLDKVTPQKYFCGVDLGSQRIKAGIIQVRENNQLDLVGIFEHKTHGFRDASVTDLNELAESIQFTLNELMNKTHSKIKDIQLGLNGDLVDVRQVSTTIPLVDRGSKVITKRDVEKLNRQARLLGLKIDEECLHELPRFYQIDEGSFAVNPVGMYGRKLTVQSLLVVTKTNRIKNILKAVHQAGFDVENIYFGSFVSSEVLLDQQDKLKGCALIDVGSKVTSIFVFHEGQLKYFEKINFGGYDFSLKIAQALNLTMDFAEEIKKSYAAAYDFERSNQEEILIKKEESYVPVKRELINQTVDQQAQEFVDAVEKSLRDSGLYEYLNRGITIMGGGALLSGLMERLEKKLNIKVQLGQIKLTSQKTIANAATYASVVGLAYQSYRKTLSSQLTPTGNEGWLQVAVNRMKLFYEEYF